MNKNNRLAKDALIASIVEEVSLRFGITTNDIEEHLQNNIIKQAKKQQTENKYKLSRSQQYFIPANIINHPTLSPLEVTVKYLKEEKGLRIRDIAILCNRDERAIGVTYHRAMKKAPTQLNIQTAAKKVPQFPLQLLHDKKLSVLEQIVTYLLDKYCLRLHEVATILGKDDRTIWTIRERAKIKIEI